MARNPSRKCTIFPLELHTFQLEGRNSKRSQSHKPSRRFPFPTKKTANEQTAPDDLYSSFDQMNSVMGAADLVSKTLQYETYQIISCRNSVKINAHISIEPIAN